MGFQLSLPTTVSIRRNTQYTVEFTVPGLEALWWISFFPRVHLDLSEAGWPTLERDLERQTRALFEQMFRLPELVAGRRGMNSMRTEDVTWSPIIEVTRTRLDKGCELYLLDRMLYEPGKESVMGHVLIPVENGREALYMHNLLRTTALSAGDGKPLHPGQAAFDDPVRDLDFSQHPLSVARAARRWLDENVPRADHRVRTVSNRRRDRLGATWLRSETATEVRPGIRHFQPGRNPRRLPRSRFVRGNGWDRLVFHPQDCRESEVGLSAPRHNRRRSRGSHVGCAPPRRWAKSAAVSCPTSRHSRDGRPC
jgi:hypothetical protein